MPPLRAAVTVLFVLLLTGCYHQVVRTGAAPGPVVIERPWTGTYLFGLVPGSAIETAAPCPNGVAIIETQQSFMNGLVGVLTLGIYTPQDVTITCAATASTAAQRIFVRPGADGAERMNAVREAVELAQRTGLVVALVAVAG